MPDINQNFSIPQGSDLTVDYDIGPDTTGLDLSTSQIKLQFWKQAFGVPDTTVPPFLTKDTTNGLTVTDPLNLKFSVAFVPVDTASLTEGNYFYKVQITDAGGKISYPTYGIMTVLRSD
jgi:hypothetical protein